MHVVLIIDPGQQVVAGRLDAEVGDMALVDALARIGLSARCSGCALRLRDVPEDVRRLIDLAGLAGALGLEPTRQPELREQLGVEEVMKPGDAPA